MTFTEDDLKTYLLGEAPEEMARAIETQVTQDEVLEARLMKLDPFAAPVQAAFEQVTPDRHPRSAHPAAPLLARPWAWQHGALAACLLVGFGLGAWIFAPSTPEDIQSTAAAWHQDVAAYQALYVPETVAAITATPEALTTQFARASAAIGQELRPSDFENVPGLTLKRAQVLGYDGAPLIQIVYATEDGTPIALCLMARAEKGQQVAHASTLENATLRGLSAIHWGAEDLDVLLIGGASFDALRPMAQVLEARLS